MELLPVDMVAFFWGETEEKIREVAKEFDCLSSCGNIVLVHLLQDKIEGSLSFKW